MTLNTQHPETGSETGSTIEGISKKTVSGVHTVFDGLDGIAAVGSTVINRTVRLGRTMYRHLFQ